MEQPNQEIGTRKDLVLYRLETARKDLRSARALLAIEDYKVPTTGLIIQSFTQSMRCTRSVERLISVIRTL